MGTKRHILLTVLGKNPRQARYALGDREAEALLAPLALIEFLDEPPDEVVALCTKDARAETWPMLDEGLRNLSAKKGREIRAHDPVDVPDGASADEVDDFLKKATASIDDIARGGEGGEVELTVDITHGFRHLTLLTYFAVVYLSVLRGIRVRGVFYGLWLEGRPSPFLDLKALITLPNWFYAVKAFAERGSALPMADLLRGEGQEREKISDALTRLSESHAAGLPLELASTANSLLAEKRKPFARLLKDTGLPLHEKLSGTVQDALKKWSLDFTPSGEGWKGKVRLSEALLGQQGRLVDDLLKRGIWPAAFGLMREWMISWSALQLGRTEKWLGHDVRWPAEQTLNALQSLHEDAPAEVNLTDDQRKVAEFWQSLKDLRNSLSHHAMRKQVVMHGQPNFDKLFDPTVKAWEDIFRQCPRIDLSVVSPERRVKTLLVSPIGSRPGVLFSAARASSKDAPGICLVVCSNESRQHVDDALRRAEYRGETHSLVLEDPFGGVKEIEGIVKSAAGHLIRAERVLVNVTGGTTLMGVAAERIANKATAFARKTKRFALIDRRATDAQVREPWVEGELLWLDDEKKRKGGDDGDND